MEAFADGVVAIIITIMVLERKVPAGHDFAALAASLPVSLAYVLSYINIGLYWNNHHHYASRPAREWPRAVGQSVSAVLAVAGAFRHPLGGRERVE